MKYVLNEDGSIKAGKNGHPLMVGDDGKEFEFNAINSKNKIGELGLDLKKAKTERNELRASYEPFKDMDAEKATEALQIVETIEDDKKVEIENVKKTLNEAWKEKEKGWETEKQTLNDNLFEANVTGKIGISPVIEKTVLPKQIFIDTFRNQFQNDGSAKGWDGKEILSKKDPSKVSIGKGV